MYAAPIEPEGNRQLSRDNIVLVALLAVVIMFEGFDISLASVVLPYIGSEFDVTTAALGQAIALIATGSIAAWLIIRLADRFGRRPVLLVAAAGFSIASLVTVFATSLSGYIVIQLIGRLMMVTLVALAYLVVSETLPAHLRGRANGILGAVASIGAALPFLLLDYALKSEIGWRLLFVVGAAPLLILPVLFFKVRETPVWQANRETASRSMSVVQELKRLVAPDLRARFAAMSALWFIVNFSSAVGTLFFTVYVTQERGWSAATLMTLAPLSLLGAFFGYVGAGIIADLYGRRPAIALFLAAYGLLTMICYSAQDRVIIIACFVGIQSMLGVWMLAFTLNSELFPTDLRAAANGWCHNLLGRWGAVAAPWLLGSLSVYLGGVGPAALALSLVAWVGIPIALFAVPETRAKLLVE